MRTIRLLSAAALTALTLQAKALINAEALVGQSSLTLTNNTTNIETAFSSQLVQAAVRLDPIPFVPVSAGLVLTVPAATDTGKTEFKDYGGLDISLQVQAWSPIRLFKMRPYVNLGMVATGKRAVKADKALTAADTTLTTQEVAIDYDVAGTQIALGINYSPLPFISLLLEAQMETFTLTPSSKTGEIDISGVKVTYNKDKYKGEATNILLGLQVGI